MILTLNNNKLTKQNEMLSNPDCIMLYVDNILQEDIHLTGVLTLTNGVERVASFSPVNSLHSYQTKLLFSEEELSYINGAKFKVVTTNSNFETCSNEITLEIDITKLKNNLIVSKSKDVTDLTKRICKLERTINDLLSSKVLQNINIINSNYIKKGMVPVAIDDNGNFIAEYPFSHLVEKLNNLEPINGEINLEAKDIPYRNKTIEEVLANITDTLEALNESILTLTQQQKEIRNSLNELSLEVEQQKNSSII